MKISLLLISGVIGTMFLAFCRPREQKFQHTVEPNILPLNAMKKSMDDSTAMNEVSAPTLDESEGAVSIPRSMLEKVPPILENGVAVQAVLRTAGVPPTAVQGVSQAGERAFQSALELRKLSTETLRFDLGKRIEIEPLSSEQIESIVQEFKNGLPPEVPAVVAGFLESRLARQLQDDFGSKMWVTLRRADALTLWDRHTPKALRGLNFLMERQLSDGKLDQFQLPAGQRNLKDYFFLEVPKDLIN